ncbi:MAG: SpoIIE family protein phosphatase [Spirochaetaceae bacterium]|nr:SpoIIE family protein phosphatase [Spirochaetaceae bacterium]
MFSESITLIPLVITFIASFYLFLLILSVNNKKSDTVPKSMMAVPIVLVVGIIITVIKPDISILAIVTAIASILVIPFFRNLKNPGTDKDQGIDVLNAPDVPDREEQEKKAEQAFFESNMSLLTAGKNFVLRAGESFPEENGLTQLLDFINTNLIHETKADGGAILLIDDFEDVISVKAYSGDFPPPYKLPEDLPHKVVRVETSFRFAQFALNENIFGAVATAGKPELITEPAADPRIYQNEPEEFLKCGSYIIVPMTLQDNVIGVVALARRYGSQVFTEKEFRSAQILTDYACASIKNVFSFQEIKEHSEMTREAEISGKLQQTLIPKQLPQIPGLSLGAFTNTSEGVCGDYYDVLPSRKDRVSFLISDVAGKGMNSLMIMIMIRAILRLIVNTTQSAATILSWANRGISVENNIDHFASLALINYDTTTNKIQFATAGSTPILYYNAQTEDISKISTSVDPIGVEKMTEYTDNEMEVHSGDIIAMYTDGIVEAVNSTGNQYSADKLIDTIKSNSKLSSKEIASLVKADIKNFTGSTRQHDDQTLLIIKVI